ncbi:magnesium and cobalt transport protein CorA [Deminuibacter soli]|uniref:Magnesium transport protein CorA n=2 Tax=Deminuibacter soli TaxID=2291815 RepID=A0A3E1NRT2_9BACT|nr:magnesium and cobalt transport protein CorA [Deminuibacter soli]
MPVNKYLNLIRPLINTKRTKEILLVNPTIIPVRQEAEKTVISIFDYNGTELKEFAVQHIVDCFECKDNNHITWINIEGLRKQDVESIGQHFGIHYLLVEDILSIGQRPKVDEIDGILFCLLNMLYFNEETSSVETEQISIALGKGFLISFQEDADRDVFDTLRARLRVANTKLRQSGADYLCYSLLDMIVDHYYLVLEKLGERIELLEEDIARFNDSRSLARINNMRKEMIVLKRNVAPVRDMVSNIIRSESELLQESTTKYFKDVYDHIMQANELVESYRDMMTSLQDLYLNKVNLKMNEVMKVLAIVTCLLAPATVIGGIFGMNFDIIPLTHQRKGFYIAVILMIIIPIGMLVMFKKRGWFKQSV